LHPDTTYVSNYVRRLPRLPELAVLNRVPRRAPRLQRKIWFEAGSNAYVYGSRRSLARRLLPAPVEGEPLFASCGVDPDEGSADAALAEQARCLSRAVHRIQAVDGMRVLVNKRIANNRRVPLLRAAFPGARFVRLVRDGRAVALSLSKVDWWLDGLVWWYGGSPRQWEAEGCDPWEICARNWVEELVAIDAGLSDVPPERVLSVRYEDFVEAPLAVITTIAEFVGLSPSTDWGKRMSMLRFPDQNEAWPRALSPAAVTTIERFQAELLIRHGYLPAAGSS
jgi:hypothetical protein